VGDAVGADVMDEMAPVADEGWPVVDDISSVEEFERLDAVNFHVQAVRPKSTLARYQCQPREVSHLIARLSLVKCQQRTQFQYHCSNFKIVSSQERGKQEG
jgi:hypothetical protein